MTKAKARQRAKAKATQNAGKRKANVDQPSQARFGQFDYHVVLAVHMGVHEQVERVGHLPFGNAVGLQSVAQVFEAARAAGLAQDVLVEPAVARRIEQVVHADRIAGDGEHRVVDVRVEFVAGRDPHVHDVHAGLARGQELRVVVFVETHEVGDLVALDVRHPERLALLDGNRPAGFRRDDDVARVGHEFSSPEFPRL